LSLAQEIAYYHHERYDGTGYPKGLKGEEIPLSARIVALADVYDALRSNRPYKRAIPHENAMNIIRKEMEGFFDPLILKTMDRIHREFSDIANAYS
jgi:putative two-component system response regulator